VPPRIKAISVIQFLHAAHHSWMVDSQWEERGGIMLIAPAGQWKTTMCYSLDGYSDALCLGDINIKSMHYIRDQILGGTYRTMVFGELEKLYARNPATAQNIEGVLKQLVEEGLRQFSFEDPRSARMPARALVVAALTPSIYGKNVSAWSESGFLRRFLRFRYTMHDPKIIMDAIEQWKKIVFDFPSVWNGRLHAKYTLEEKDAKFLRSIIRNQEESTPFVLLQKTACVLKLRLKDDWKNILEDIAPGFGKDGGLLTI
jgi:hypothetical protein